MAFASPCGLGRGVDALPAHHAHGFQIAADGRLRHLVAQLAQRSPDLDLPLHRLGRQELEDRLAALVLVLTFNRHPASLRCGSLAGPRGNLKRVVDKFLHIVHSMHIYEKDAELGVQPFRGKNRKKATPPPVTTSTPSPTVPPNTTK